MAFDPNTLFYEMCQIFQNNYSTDNKVIICNEGSTRCFDGNQLVVTNEGDKPIKDVVHGDMVLTYNEATGENEYNQVNESLEVENQNLSHLP